MIDFEALHRFLQRRRIDFSRPAPGLQGFGHDRVGVKWDAFKKLCEAPGAGIPIHALHVGHDGQGQLGAYSPIFFICSMQSGLESNAMVSSGSSQVSNCARLSA